MMKAIYVFLFGAALAGVQSLNAATLYSIASPLQAAGSIVSYQALGVSWTQNATYTNLIVSAELQGLSTDSLTAYLSTQIGPGTTTANVIAEATVSFPGSTPSFTNVALFDIPVLQAGTYDLTFYSNGSTGDLAGAQSRQPVQTVDSSFTLNPQYFFEGTPQLTLLPSNPLALTPNYLAVANPYAFSLTGNVVSVSATTPEPLPSALVGSALGLFVMGVWFQRSRMRRA